MNGEATRNGDVKIIPMKGEKFASFEKSARSQQGMAIWKDRAFLFYHGGSCDAMDLKSRKVISAFRLESYTGDGRGPYINHANQAIFSHCAPDSGTDIPVVYITAGNDAGMDEDGYYGRCITERIAVNRDDGTETYSAHTLQTIIYNDAGRKKGQMGKYADAGISVYEPPCWGWPSFIPDTQEKFLYLFSARYRTKLREFDAVNSYIITKFRLPELKDGRKVILKPEDILDQFMAEYLETGATQGGMLYRGKIFYTFGFGRDDFPDALRIYDLKKRRLIGGIDLSGSVFAGEEIESCGVYEGNLLCNTNAGGIYSLGDIDRLLLQFESAEEL